MIDWNVVVQIAIVLLGILASHLGLRKKQNQIHQAVCPWRHDPVLKKLNKKGK